MILLRILDHDLHRSKRGIKASPLMIEIPARDNFLPAIISNTRGKFIAVRKMVKEKQENVDGYIRVGMFEHHSDRMDEILSDLFDAAYNLSRDEGWNNIFFGKNAANYAFNYIGDASGMSDAQPHVCLVPKCWTSEKIQEFFGVEYVGDKYKKFCRVVSTDVTLPVFLSRPDMVGMYTQFLGGKSGIILHNVRLGIAFCHSDLTN